MALRKTQDSIGGVLLAQIMLVASGKGGVGKSTVTCAISQVLTKMGKRVLIIDGDAGLRCQDILLDLTDSVILDWGDVLCGNEEAENAVIAKEGKPHLLPAPLIWAPEWTAEEFKKMTDRLSENYDYVFIDAPAGVGPGLALLARSAKMAIIVSGSEAAGIRGACAAGDVLKGLGVVSRRLVINSVRPELIRKGILPNLDSVIDRTELRLIGVLPFDEDINRGAAAGELKLDEKSLYLKAATALSLRVTGKNVPITKFR